MHRSNASVPGLTWDDHMASLAAQIAASCVYAHDTSTGGGGYGQNIGAGAPPADIPAMITNQMYNDEIGFYPGYGGEPDMSNFEAWGHYSQIVWKSTSGVGCATQYCPGGLANTGGNVSPYFTVCNYSPPGMFLRSLRILVQLLTTVPQAILEANTVQMCCSQAINPRSHCDLHLPRIDDGR